MNENQIVEALDEWIKQVNFPLCQDKKVRKENMQFWESNILAAKIKFICQISNHWKGYDRGNPEKGKQKMIESIESNKPLFKQKNITKEILATRMIGKPVEQDDYDF